MTGRVTVQQMGGTVAATREITVPEWDDATVLLRALTRGQIREARKLATEDGTLDQDLFDLAVVAYAFADPDLTGTVGGEEAMRLLQAQPLTVISLLVREAVMLSALSEGAPFRRRTADDAER